MTTPPPSAAAALPARAPADDTGTAPRPSAVGAVAVGGLLGSLGRYAVSLQLPHPADGFPWSTLTVNVSGSLVMGMLMAYLVLRARPESLLRPFVGVGLLGGWTTFSAFAVDTLQLAQHGRADLAVLYVAASFVGAVAAVHVGSVVAAWVLPARLAADPMPPEAGARSRDRQELR